MVTTIDHYVKLEIRSRNYLSITHLSSACFFAKRAGEIEETNTIDTARQSDAFREHLAFTTSTIMLSCAFLEATINEIFCDCADSHDGDFSSLPGARDMALLWRNGVPRSARYKVFEKYNKALELNGKPLIGKAEEVSRNLRLVTDLRNALIHYEPETVLTFASEGRTTSEVHDFEKSLAGKFPENTLTGVGNAFYPDKVLGYGCAIWAVKSAVAFTDSFFTLLGIKPKYDGIRLFLAEAEGRVDE